MFNEFSTFVCENCGIPTQTFRRYSAEAPKNVTEISQKLRIFLCSFSGVSTQITSGQAWWHTQGQGAHHTHILQIALNLTQTWSPWTAPRHGPAPQISTRMKDDKSDEWGFPRGVVTHAHRGVVGGIADRPKSYHGQAEPVRRNGGAYDSGFRDPVFESRSGKLVFLLGEEINRHC